MFFFILLFIVSSFRTEHNTQGGGTALTINWVFVFVENNRNPQPVLKGWMYEIREKFYNFLRSVCTRPAKHHARLDVRVYSADSILRSNCLCARGGGSAQAPPSPTDTYNIVRESDDGRQRPTGEWIHLRINVFYVQCYYYALYGARSKDDITNLTSPI